MTFHDTLQRFGGPIAMMALLLRAGVVGFNFLVIVGLATGLGFETFGALIFLWGLSMVLSTIISVGGPILLLRNVSQSRVVRLRDLAALIIFFPAAVSLIFWCGAQLLPPTGSWVGVLFTAFSINAVSCVGSVMRGLGSVHTSMVVRDAVPVAALGIAGWMATKAAPADILMLASAGMLVIVFLSVLIFVLRQKLERAPGAARTASWSWSLWGTSVLGMLLAQIDLIVGGR